MISTKRTAIFPLRICCSVPLANGEPVVLADRLALLNVGLAKPGNDQGRLRFKLAVSHVVVGQRAIEWILSRDKGNGNVISPRSRIRCVESPIVVGPVGVP